MTMKKINREQRYIVIKIKDADNALNLEQRDALERTLEHIDAYRYVKGKDDLKCVVVESDWDEYESTWKAIEQRIAIEELQAFKERFTMGRRFYMTEYDLEKEATQCTRGNPDIDNPVSDIPLTPMGQPDCAYFNDPLFPNNANDALIKALEFNARHGLMPTTREERETIQSVLDSKGEVLSQLIDEQKAIEKEKNLRWAFGC